MDGKEEEAVYLLLLLLFVKAQSPLSLLLPIPLKEAPKVDSRPPFLKFSPSPLFALLFSSLPILSRGLTLARVSAGGAVKALSLIQGGAHDSAHKT